MTMLLLVLVAVVSALIAYIALVPDGFRIARSAVVDAPAEAIFAQVNDFHNWRQWSPWEKLDPAMERSFEGSPLGFGAIYGWSGNKKVGKGRMKIVESLKDERIKLKLAFEKPFQAMNQVQFDFKPISDAQTEVTWAMTGKHEFITKTMSRFFGFENIVGGQYEEGLANLKRLLETPRVGVSS